jgi:general secretion pathway protein B
MARAKTRQPWWVFAVAALLLVNLIVLVYVLLRPDREPQVGDAPERPAAATAAPSAAAPQIAVQTPLPKPASKPISQPVSATAAPAATPPGTAPAAGPPATNSLAAAAGLPALGADDPTLTYSESDAVAATVPAGPPVVQAHPAPGARAPASSSDETLPTLNDLTLSGAVQVPELHLDIHVYAQNPPERFVFVNMRKYVEGQRLQEGPVVERITQDGVVLNQQGMRFLLPSQ